MLLDKLRQQYLPGRIIAMATEGQNLRSQARIIPLMKHKSAVNARPTVYVCENKTCQAPTNDPEVLAKQLAELFEIPGVKKAGNKL